MKKQIGIWLLLLAGLLTGCASGTAPEALTQAAATHSADSSGQSTAAAEDPCTGLQSIRVNGVDIGKFSIVYATEFTRENCWEDYRAAACELADALRELAGVELPVLPDTAEAQPHEILLGIAYRAECSVYYEPEKELKPDEFRAEYANGKILLGGDCMGSVAAACNAFVRHLAETAVDGTAELSETFSLTGERHIRRIVCVGDSITQGVGAEDEVSGSYPAYLQQALGSGYDVVNLGKGGATMCSVSDALYVGRSYITQSGYYERLLELAGQTDVVLIMLGSNDGSWTDSVNALLQDRPEEFQTDFRLNLTLMVRELRKRNPEIRIWLFNAPVCFGAREQNFQNYIRPFQKAMADELELEWYDMYGFTKANLPQSTCFSDGIHPNSAGYRKIGEEVARLLSESFQ